MNPTDKLNHSPPPKKILLIRTSAMGDVVIATGLVKALRAAHPSAAITWLVDETYRTLVEHHPDLAGIIIWPRSRWKRLLREHRYREWLMELRSMIKDLRRDRYDWVIDTQGLLKSGIWAFLSRARRRIGFGSREGTQYLMHEVIPRPSEKVRRGWENYTIGNEYLPVLQAMELPTTAMQLHVKISPQDSAAAIDKLPHTAMDRGYIVLCPFTTRPQKHWITPRWSELTRQLLQEHGMDVVVLGGKADQAEATAIVQSISGGYSLAGKTSMAEAGAILQHARLVIGVDTGLTHLGVAMHTPTLALFGSTCPYLVTGAAPGKVLYHHLDCSPCGRHPTCDGAFTCMAMHTSAEVSAHARELLKQANSLH